MTPLWIACAARFINSASRYQVLARGDGEVVDGHLRLKAARKLGLIENPGAPLRRMDDSAGQSVPAAGKPIGDVGRLPTKVWDRECIERALEKNALPIAIRDAPFRPIRSRGPETKVKGGRR